MALEKSPASSGRSSPAPRALQRRALEDGQKADKNFRKYAAGVERALSLFDTTQQEWADYISFLGRLLKALQVNPPDNRIIPHSTIVATRLAQCLNPALPSGVHQKALEEDALATDLQIYFSGLSSVLSFASLSVRPALLDLVEQYFVPLGPHSIRPALKAVILALLPGLEDETSEDFDRILQLLNRFRKSSSPGVQTPGSENDTASSDSYFWQCMFLAAITNPSRRQGALAFLTRNMPRLISDGTTSTLGRRSSVADLSVEAHAVVSPEPGLLVRCFVAGLSDSQLLIQRGFLDLLVSHLPLASSVLQKAVPTPDLERLMIAAASVVNRRDMSLNRRLWAWFLGPEPKSNADDASMDDVKSGNMDVASHHAAYFSQFGSRPLAAAILKMLQFGGSTPSSRARPFRICLSLMDWWEVGGLLVPEVFVPAVQSVFDYSLVASKEHTDEVIRSASIFFDGVESGLIWSQLSELATAALGSESCGDDDRLQKLRLYSFIVGKFNIREEEMIMHHVPLSLLGLLALIHDDSKPSNMSPSVAKEVREITIQICEILIKLIPERAFLEHSTSSPTEQQPKSSTVLGISVTDISAKIKTFYGYKEGAADIDDMPFSTFRIGQMTLRLATEHLISALKTKLGLEPCTKLLTDLMYKVPGSANLCRDLNLSTSIRLALETSGSGSAVVEFPVLSAMTAATAALHFASTNTAPEGMADTSRLTTVLIQSLWHYLSPLNPKYHVEATRCIWTLEAISFPERHVESALTLLLDCASGSDPGRRFATLWNHTVQERSSPADRNRGGSIRRVSGMPGMPSGSSTVVNHESILTQPLLLLLDALAGNDSELSAFVVTWLQELPGLQRVFSILTSRICGLQCMQRSQYSHLAPSKLKNAAILPWDDSKECLYYLQHIDTILKHASDHTWNCIAGGTTLGFDVGSQGEQQEVVLQNLLIEICMDTLAFSKMNDGDSNIVALHRSALSILHNVLRGPFAAPLKELGLELTLLDLLQRSLNDASPLLQSSLLATILAALRLRSSSNTASPMAVPESPTHARRASKTIGPRPSAASDHQPQVSLLKVPPQLISCLRAGFSSPSSRLALDSWVEFFIEVLPLFADSIFQSLIPLVENFCSQIALHFGLLKSTFEHADSQSAPESSLIGLMNGLEQILAQAHEKLLAEEAQAVISKTPDQPQGFFGNMVGVFAAEAQQISRSASSNNRLTVLLCFQDTLRICFSLWSWGAPGSRYQQDPSSVASYGYISLRIRNRARRLLEHLFAAEAMECLETLCVLWCRPPNPQFDSRSIISLLNVLNESKPKNTIPAIFNALYSRTNPTALEPRRTSSLTSDLADTEIVMFLLAYMRSLEDDTMDEIWADCITFLKDVLTNPMPHRQTLPALLEFTVILAEKIENTNFGEERKMRRELADLFVRLLTATFTTRPMGFVQDASQSPPGPKSEEESIIPTLPDHTRMSDVVAMLAGMAPKLQLVLVDNDRLVISVASISANVISPAIHSKHFPDNVSFDTLVLLQQLCMISQASKSWRKDVSDAFNGPRFFNIPHNLVKDHWLPILLQLHAADQERMAELLARLVAPATAGVFGVGAASARQESDRRTQTNLRRIAVLVLACPEDTFVSSIALIAEKVSELLTATPITSPSSVTRAELFMLIRTLALKVSAVHLAPLWPIVNAELAAALASALPDSEEAERYDSASLLQACKLLDVLVTVGPDDFQLYEWLFITDTIDAVYKPAEWTPAALVDEIAEGLGSAAAGTDEPPSSLAAHTQSASSSAMRLPFLEPILAAFGSDVKDAKREDLIRRVLRPFFGQLSILAFEATYGMQAPDVQACRDDLLADLFDEAH